MSKMVQFRATAKGYYGDIIHDPENEKHVLFMAPEDFECSWAERADGEVAAAPAEVSEDTLNAESQLNAESAAAAPVVAEPDPAASDDIPADAEDVNEATGVEVL